MSKFFSSLFFKKQTPTCLPVYINIGLFLFCFEFIEILSFQNQVEENPFKIYSICSLSLFQLRYSLVLIQLNKKIVSLLKLEFKKLKRKGSYQLLLILSFARSGVEGMGLDKCLYIYISLHVIWMKEKTFLTCQIKF